MVEIHCIGELLYFKGVAQMWQFWESTWDSLEKNGSFYFEKIYFPTKYLALETYIGLLIEKENSSLTIYCS